MISVVFSPSPRQDLEDGVLDGSPDGVTKQDAVIAQGLMQVIPSVDDTILLDHDFRGCDSWVVTDIAWHLNTKPQNPNFLLDNVTILLEKVDFALLGEDNEL